MEVTEVRIKLMRNRKDKLKAFCSVTFDNSFVVRDLKIIEGLKGIFVAMPSRKLTERCPKCGTKNHLRSNFCNECGLKLSEKKRVPTSAKLHADIAHPINSDCRQMIQTKILENYKEEAKKVFGEDVSLDRISTPEEEGYAHYEDEEMDYGEETASIREEMKSQSKEKPKEKSKQDEFGAGIFG